MGELGPALLPAVIAAVGAVLVAGAARRAPVRARVAVLGPAVVADRRTRSDPPAGARRALAWCAEWLGRAGIELTPAQAVATWVGAVIVVGGVAGSFAPAASPVGAVAAAGVLPAWVVRRARAIDGALVHEVPVVLEHVASELRAGASVSSALATADRCGPAAARLTVTLRHRLALGAGAGEALVAWRHAVPERAAALAGAVRVAAAALRAVERTGGPGADALDAVARGLRDHAEVADEVRALAVQARASAHVVTGAPVAHLALSSAAGTGGVGDLVATGTGRTCLVLGLVLLVLAHRWMGRIVERSR
jgi:Flp pilus assembly protein TadB